MIRETSPIFAAGWRRGAALGLVLLCCAMLMGCDSVEERAEKHYQNGVELVAAGETVKATLEFRNAVKLNENHAGAHFELGRIFEDRKDLAAALFHFRKSVQIDGANMQAHLSLGEIQLAFNRVEGALTSALAAARIEPDNIEVLTLEAAISLRLDEVDQAREKAARALEIDDQAAEPWVILAAISRREGDDAKALEQINEGLRRDPGNISALITRVSLLSIMRKEVELGAALEELANHDPEELSFWDALARWQLRNGRFDEAAETLRKVSELAPNDTARQLDLVRLIAATTGRDEAIAELERLIELRAESDAVGRLELALAEVKIQTGDLEGAETIVRRVIDERPEDPAFLRARPLLGRLRLAQGDTDGAREIIDQTLADDPTNSGALTLRGRILITEERYEEAIRDLRAAEAEDLDNVETLRLQAQAHRLSGDDDLARDVLAKAVQRSGQDVDTVLDYARFLFGVDGDADLAAGVLQDALSTHPGDLRLIEAFGRVKLRMNAFEEVERLARGLQQREAAKELGDRLLAAALAGQERYDETIEILEANQEGSAREGAYLAALVATHLRNDDMTAAQQLVSRALETDPDDSNAVRLDATLALVDGRVEEAGEGYRRAVELGPDLPINHLALFRYHLRRGEPQIAEAALRAGIEQTDANSLHLNMAMVHEARGRVGDAIDTYQLLYDRQPGSEVVANNLASLITDSDPTPEQIDRAYTIARRLRNSEVPHFMDTYGWLLFLRGDAKGAREKIEVAAEKLPDNPVVQYHLGRVLAELGESDAAREAYRHAAELARGRDVPQIADVEARLAALPATDGADTPGAAPATIE